MKLRTALAPAVLVLAMLGAAPHASADTGLVPGSGTEVDGDDGTANVTGVTGSGGNVCRATSSPTFWGFSCGTGSAAGVNITNLLVGGGAKWLIDKACLFRPLSAADEAAWAGEPPEPGMQAYRRICVGGVEPAGQDGWEVNGEVTVTVEIVWADPTDVTTTDQATVDQIVRLETGRYPETEVRVWPSRRLADSLDTLTRVNVPSYFSLLEANGPTSKQNAGVRMWIERQGFELESADDVTSCDVNAPAVDGDTVPEPRPGDCYLRYSSSGTRNVVATVTWQVMLQDALGNERAVGGPREVSTTIRLRVRDIQTLVVR